MIYCGLQILIWHFKLIIRQSNISLKWLGAYVFCFDDSKFLFGLEDLSTLFSPAEEKNIFREKDRRPQHFCLSSLTIA